MARAGSVLSGYFPPMYPDQFPADQVPNLPDLPDGQMLPPDVALSATDGQLATEAEPAAELQPATEAELVADTEPATDGQLDEAPPRETLVVEEVRPSQSQGWTAVKRASARIE